MMLAPIFVSYGIGSRLVPDLPHHEQVCPWASRHHHIADALIACANSASPAQRAIQTAPERDDYAALERPKLTEPCCTALHWITDPTFD
jgi:hypothetical protein